MPEQPALLRHRLSEESTLNSIRIALLGAVVLWFAALFPAFAGDVGGLGKVVSGRDLEAQRGGHETQVFNDMKVNGNVTGNTATANVTGNNSINNAFTGASGLPIVVQNTGNNVLIQNATIVNLQMQ